MPWLAPNLRREDANEERARLTVPRPAHPRVDLAASDNIGPHLVGGDTAASVQLTGDALADLGDHEVGPRDEVPLVDGDHRRGRLVGRRAPTGFDVEAHVDRHCGSEVAWSAGMNYAHVTPVSPSFVTRTASDSPVSAGMPSLVRAECAAKPSWSMESPR